MTQPTFPNIFGTGATRLASGAAAPSAGLFIPDSALQASGLNAPPTASAQQHFVAVVKTAKTFLTETNFQADIDQKIYIEEGFRSSTTRGTNNTPYNTRQLNITLAKEDTESDFDPDNY